MYRRNWKNILLLKFRLCVVLDKVKIVVFFFMLGGLLFILVCYGK